MFYLLNDSFFLDIIVACEMKKKELTLILCVNLLCKIKNR